MSLQLKLLTAAGIDPPSPPSYKHRVSENVDTGQIWKDVLTAVQVDMIVLVIIIVVVMRQIDLKIVI